jgi:hypothetical protein
MVRLVQHLKFAGPERGQFLDTTLRPVEILGRFKPQQFAFTFFADDVVMTRPHVPVLSGRLHSTRALHLPRRITTGVGRVAQRTLSGIGVEARKLSLVTCKLSVRSSPYADRFHPTRIGNEEANPAFTPTLLSH